VFNLLGGDTVAVASTRIFQVNAVDGRFTALAGANGTPTLTHSTGSFSATINGQANLFGLNFSFGDASGLNFTATSTIERLRNVRFTNLLAGAGSRHLTVTSPGLDLDCPGCFFDTVAGGQFNVWAVDSNVGNGVPLRLRFENRTTSSTPGSIGGPGAGETWDGDDDTNDDGQILAPETTTVHGGAIVQWVYTANVDMTGSIQGFPMPAFDWTTFSVYSTYVLMRNSSGATDSIYVLNSNGDLKSYSFTLPGADIVGPLFWSTEPSGHYVYFGTSTGEVYRLIDNGSSLVPAGGSWSTPYTDSANLLAVTSPVMSDGTNLYFAGQSSTTPIFALYKVVIATKSAPNPRISLSDVLVTTGFSWWDTLAGRYIYGASQASGGQSYIGRAVASSWTIDAVFASASLNPPAADCTSSFNGNVNVAVWAFGSTPYLYAAEENGYVHAVTAAGTAAEFSTQRPGYPFRDKVSAVRSGVGVEFGTGRVFFGNDAGDLYTMGTFGTGWVLNTNYFRLATPGGLPIQGMPLYSYGVLYASNTGGKVFVVDANNGAGQTLARTYNLGSNALGDLSRDPEFGRIYVASSGGRLYAFESFADPTPGVP
jgi:hypothetical protein